MKERLLGVLCIMTLLLSGCGLRQTVVVREAMSLRDIDVFLTQGLWQQPEQTVQRLQACHRFIMALPQESYEELRYNWQKMLPDLTRLSQRLELGVPVAGYQFLTKDFSRYQAQFLHASKIHQKRQEHGLLSFGFSTRVGVSRR